MRTIAIVAGTALTAGLLVAAGLTFRGEGGAATTTGATRDGTAVPAGAAPSATTLATATIPPPPSPRASDPPVTSGTGQVGTRAITPRATPAAPGQPTFTEEDVRAFIAANGLDLIRVRADGPYQIERVAFLPSSEARAREGVYVGVPDDRPLCLVSVRGTFTLVGPPVPNQEPTVRTFSTMTLIFDGLTGNRLGERGQP